MKKLLKNFFVGVTAGVATLIFAAINGAILIELITYGERKFGAVGGLGGAAVWLLLLFSVGFVAMDLWD